MGSLVSPTHLLFIAAIALIFLGPKKLPELARSLGAGMREFRESISGESQPDAAHDDTVATLPPPVESHAPPAEPFTPMGEPGPLHAVPEPVAPTFPTAAPSQATPLRSADRPDPPPSVA